MSEKPNDNKELLTQHECDCDCHSGECMHFMPCCSECDICNVRVLDIYSHMKTYHPNYK